jgi:cell division GTPase FtsZ
MQQALQAIESLRAVVDTLIIVSNDRWATRMSSDNFDFDFECLRSMLMTRDRWQAERATIVLNSLDSVA